MTIHIDFPLNLVSRIWNFSPIRNHSLCLKTLTCQNFLLHSSWPGLQFIFAQDFEPSQFHVDSQWLAWPTWSVRTYTDDLLLFWNGCSTSGTWKEFPSLATPAHSIRFLVSKYLFWRLLFLFYALRMAYTCLCPVPYGLWDLAEMWNPWLLVQLHWPGISIIYTFMSCGLPLFSSLRFTSCFNNPDNTMIKSQDSCMRFGTIREKRRCYNCYNICSTLINERPK